MTNREKLMYIINFSREYSGDCACALMGFVTDEQIDRLYEVHSLWLKDALEETMEEMGDD